MQSASGPKRQAGYQTPLPRSTGRLIIRINGHISRNRGHEPEKRRHTDPHSNRARPEILLPAIQLNGKQKQKLYVRNQILRKKKNSKESNTAYLVTGIDDEHSRTIAYQTSLPAEQWMNDAALYLRRTIVRPESEQTLKDTLILAPQYAVLPPNVTATDIPAQEISATTMSTNSMPSISPTPVNKN